MAKIHANIIMVDVKKIFPNPWNPNRQSDFIFQKERESIRRHGFIGSVTAREKKGSKGEFEIIDGEHRWRAADAEGLPEIPVNNLGQVKDAVAKQLTIIMNETRGKADPDLLVHLVQDLKNEMDIEELAEVLPFESDELQDLLERAQIDWSKSDGGQLVKDGPEQAPSAKNKGPEPKYIHIQVGEKTYKDFYAALEKVQIALNPGIDTKQADPELAVKAMNGILLQNDIESLLVKKKTVLRKGAQKNRVAGSKKS